MRDRTEELVHELNNQMSRLQTDTMEVLEQKLESVRDMLETKIDQKMNESKTKWIKPKI